jgi:4-azaleucine resistance transporter AzlC
VRDRYLEGARAIAPIGVTAVAFGISFGVLARTAGMGWAAPLVMSATTFAGSAQFAVASVLGNAGAAAAAIAAAVMLNARYAPISISVASAFEGSPVKRLLQAQLIVDESWAIALGRREGFDVRVLLGAGGLLYVCWNGGTALGVLLGDAIGDPNRLGLDAAFPALFLALLVPQLADRRAIAAAVLGGAIALALIPFSPAGVPIVAGAAACLVGARTEPRQQASPSARDSLP